MKIGLLLVDDHAMLRAGIRNVLEAEETFKVLKEEAQSSEQAMELVKKLEPQVVLMDLKMPSIGGLKAISNILARTPDTKILVLTRVVNTIYAARVLKAGGSGYILKSNPTDELVRAIKKVASGQTYLSREIAEKLAHDKVTGKGDSPFDKLSRQEMQMVFSVIRGEKTNVIAKRHHIATKTVNSYRYRVFGKLGFKNNVQLTLLAVQSGLIDADEDFNHFPDDH